MAAENPRRPHLHSLHRPELARPTAPALQWLRVIVLRAITVLAAPLRHAKILVEP